MQKIDIEEIWATVLGYEGLYEASDQGRIKSLNYGGTGKTKVMKPTIDRFGYLRLGLTKDGKTKKFRVHRLVFSAFNGPIPEGFVVDHVNNARADNRLENLQLLTQRDNARKALLGRKLSEETRAKLSVSHKGKTPWLGKKHTEESKRKMSNTKKGRKITEEQKAKISATLKGRPRTEETKAKIAATLKGHIPWNKGKTHTEETKAKMRAAAKARREREKS